jgi:hypothetical protein
MYLDKYEYINFRFDINSIIFSSSNHDGRAVPWLRRLVAVLSPRRPGFNHGSVHVGFVVDKVALGQVFPEYFGFPLSISFHPCPITWKNGKTDHLSLHLHHRVAQ